MSVTGTDTQFWQVLAQPVCASSAERNWSVYGMFNQDGRVLAHAPRDRANKRVYCHEALHLKEKLQSAGYKQEAVGWDTDVRRGLRRRDGSATETWLCSCGN